MWGDDHPIIEAQKIKSCYEGAGEFNFAEWYFIWGEEAEVKSPCKYEFDRDTFFETGMVQRY